MLKQCQQCAHYLNCSDERMKAFYNLQSQFYFNDERFSIKVSCKDHKHIAGIMAWEGKGNNEKSNRRNDGIKNKQKSGSVRGNENA